MILLILITLFITLLSSIFFVYVLTLLPPNQGRYKHGGVYSVTSSYYHFKYGILLLLLKVRQWRQKKPSVGNMVMYDLEERRALKKLEKTHTLEEKDSIDSVYFFCTGKLAPKDGSGDATTHTIDVIVRVARRSNRVNEHWIMLRKDGEPLLLHQSAPGTAIGNCSADGWTTLTGLSVHCDRPNEKWTVKYHGWLKEAENNGKSIHVNLKMSFTAFTNIFDSHKDTSLELAADAIARESWTRAFFDELKNFQEKKQTHYEQWGGYSGSVTFNREQSYDLHQCKGYRDHSFGIRNWAQYQRYGTFFGYLENGSCFSLGSVCCRGTLSHVRHGYFITGYGDTRPVTSHDFDLWRYFIVSPPRSKIVIEFYAGGERYELVATETAKTNFDVSEGNTEIYERFMTFTLNGERGRGVGEYCASDAVPQFKYSPVTSVGILSLPTLSRDSRRCISITNEGCRDRTVSGGKGAHLADLVKLSRSYKQIVIPEGCVITTMSFDEFLEINEYVRKSIQKLEHSGRNISENSAREVCKEIQIGINEANISQELWADIEAQLLIDIGEDWRNVKVAIRSSSADEDASGASSAGQMDTYLGVRGEEEIMASIKKCWASMYSFQAVTYRHKCGQPISGKMAVVVMKMVASESSGVLFTVNPLDGDATRMVVNAAFGLGEAIVSGKCVPDNFIVEVDINGFVSVQSRILGGKEVRIDMEEERAGLCEQTIQSTLELSLSDEDVLNLARIGILIQECYGEPCDIEWASSNGVFYILQVRPITSLNIVSDYDLVHEFDSSLSMEDELLTSANIGEMMPQAVTPLTLSIFGSAIDRTMQTIPRIMGIYKTYLHPRRFLPSFSNHLFINIHCIQLMPVKSALFSDIRMTFLALMGRVLDRPTKEDILRFGGSETFWKKLNGSVNSMRNRFQGTSKTLAWEKKFDCGYKVPMKRTSKAQMEAIVAQLDDYYRCWLDTVANTSQSAIWSMVIMKMLEGPDGWTQHEYSQIATLLSTCSNVYSADVPTALENIAVAICNNSENKELFLEGNTETCLKWLQSTESKEVGEMYDEFLKRHGHRCIRESEFREKSWRSDQSKLISALKPMVSQMKEENNAMKKELSVEEAIETLEVTFNPIKKVILKWILKKARRGVGLREWGKSLSIQMCEIFKQAFNRLGELMVAENLIPDEDLLNFFTSDELVTILIDGDEPMSNFIGRALRRRKVMNLQMQAQMPEISYGTPSEIQRDIVVESGIQGPGTKIYGLPVSIGQVAGMARVIRTVEEAAHIQSGEILVVPYTDVGWTPYFPMLGGLVTEKGGLLSHGAVVAREYGLPCVVACVGATEVFRTGDYLLLNATGGTVELSARP